MITSIVWLITSLILICNDYAVRLLAIFFMLLDHLGFSITSEYPGLGVVASSAVSIAHSAFFITIKYGGSALCKCSVKFI